MKFCVLCAQEPKLPHPIEQVPFQVGGLGGEPACEMTHTMDEIVPPLGEMAYTVDETLPPPSSTDDRAIVLYTPANTFLNLGPVPSNHSLLVSPQLLRNLKSKLLNLHVWISPYILSFYGWGLLFVVYL